MLYTVGQLRRDGDPTRARSRRERRRASRAPAGRETLGDRVLLGTFAAIAVSGAMDQLLWNVEPTDPLTIAAVAPRCLRSRRSDREPPELWSVDEAGAHAV
jgi:hypothetical protein